MQLKSEDWFFKIESKNQLIVIRTLLASNGYKTEYCELKYYDNYKYIIGDLGDNSFDFTLSNSKEDKEEVDYEEFLNMIIGKEEFEEKIGDYTATYKKGEKCVHFSNGSSVLFERIIQLGELLDKTFIKNPTDWFLPINDNEKYLDFLHNYLGSKGLKNNYVSSGFSGYTAVIESKRNEFCMTSLPAGKEITTLEFLEMVDNWQPNSSFKLLDNYDCRIGEDYVKIGCQIIDKEEVKEFINKLKQFA